MLKLNSIKISLKGSPRIDQHPFESVEDWMTGVNPLSSEKKKYDSGKTRLTFPDLSPMGRNEIAHEPGEKTQHDGATSGYDRGLDPAGPPDDEEGNLTTGEPRNPDPKYVELAFRSESDTSSNLFLNQESRMRDKPIWNNLNRIRNKKL